MWPNSKQRLAAIAASANRHRKRLPTAFMSVTYPGMVELREVEDRYEATQIARELEMGTVSRAFAWKQRRP